MELRNKKSNWIQLKEIITNKQVIVSLLATMTLLILFRIGANLTLPGIKLTSGDSIDTQTSFLGILNILGGGGITQFSFMAVGVSPYITAQIIIQLLSTDIIKPLVNLNKQGEKGKRKIEIINRVLAMPFAFMQAYAVLSLATNQGAITVYGQSSLNALSSWQMFSLLIGMVAGTYLTIFLADIISKRGIGNGITLIILSGIVSSLYTNFSSVYTILVVGSTANNILRYLSFIVYIVFFVIILLIVIFMNGTTRKIPIQQIGQGLSTDTSEMAYLPIKLNAAGVIPVIFASSIMTIPPTIAQFLSESSNGVSFINKYLAIETPVGLTIYAVLICLFGFFYAHVQINPEKLSENLKKSGKYIPGVKVGLETEKYLTRTLNRINCIGVPFLMSIAITPYIISMTTNIPNGLAIGGTGLIIMVSGSLEFWQALKSAQTNYGYSNLTKRLKTDFEYAMSNDESKESKHLW